VNSAPSSESFSFPGLLNIKINLETDSHLKQHSGPSESKQANRKSVESPEWCKGLSVFPVIGSLVLGKMVGKWFFDTAEMEILR